MQSHNKSLFSYLFFLPVIENSFKHVNIQIFLKTKIFLNVVYFLDLLFSSLVGINQNKYKFLNFNQSLNKVISEEHRGSQCQPKIKMSCDLNFTFCPTMPHCTVGSYWYVYFSPHFMQHDILYVSGPFWHGNSIRTLTKVRVWK